jgi:YesN/AraC family two-component response regulator
VANALKYEPVFSVELDEIENTKENDIEALDLKNDFFVELKRLLEIAMVKEKVYLDDALTIHSLAAQLKTNRKYLSQLINTEFKKSFVVFVNEYRVAEAKELLKSEENRAFTIEAIGYKAGFKSKSAFNTVFKKISGETPSSFLKEGK